MDRVTSSTLRSWVWDGGRQLATDAEGPKIARMLDEHPDAVAIVELPRSRVGELDDDSSLDLDDLAVEDLGSDSERSRLDVVGDAVVILSRTTSFDPAGGDLTHRPLGLILTDRVFAVVEDDAEFGRLAPVLEAACGSLGTDGTSGVLHAVLDTVVDGYSATMTALEDQADALAEALFNDHPLDRGQQLHAFRLRRALTALRRVVEPMSDVAAALADAATRDDDDPDEVALLISSSTARRFADVSDHVAHVADLIDGQRDVLSSLYQTSLSLADVRLNTIMKKLSGWAAIIAVPTLITGFMGMNVPYPGYGTTAGFIGAGVVLVVAVALLYLMFRRKGWL